MQTAGTPVYLWAIAGAWVVFMAYWAISATGVKKSAGRPVWRRELAVRLALVLVAVAVLRIPAGRHFFMSARGYAPSSALLGMAGAIACTTGIGLAIWARVYLGRNWGLPMSQKVHPDLVTTGPYAYVRHPIYAGIILATIGSAIGASIFWFLPLVIILPYFAYSARVEERTMEEQFPEQYRAYRARTKMFVPFML